MGISPLGALFPSKSGLIPETVNETIMDLQIESRRWSHSNSQLFSRAGTLIGNSRLCASLIESENFSVLDSMEKLSFGSVGTTISIHFKFISRKRGRGKKGAGMSLCTTGTTL